ncbi:phytoene desaturase [Pseudonocardiaceae bacterium YIM PH 21723]|nr:phytoene desaturase [Pseudonocardiaceae bacterium YIM PH 21723]
MHTVIIGAGLSGLSCALYLTGAGHRVTVLDGADRVGGVAGRVELGGFHLDTGPTVLTMPELIDEALAAAGGSLEADLPLIRLDPAYHARFADGSHIRVHTDAEAMEAEVRATCGPGDAAGYRRLRDWLTRLYRVQRDDFIGRNFDSPFQLFTPQLARLAALGGFGRLGPRVGRFISDDRLRRVFSFQSLYAGVAPAQALAAYAVIAYMDTIAGVYFPRSGGMHAVPTAMAGVARRAGAEFRLSTAATGLERRGDLITAVLTEDDRIPCDAVVLATDPHTAYRLLGGTPNRPVAHRWSPSAFVVHAGTDNTAGPAEHHTISFGAAWDRTFTEIIDRGELMSDPSLLLTQPTATDPGLAPPGKRLYYLLAPSPNRLAGPSIDWDRLAPAYLRELRETLGRRNLDWSVSEVQQVTTPADWTRSGHPAGTPFSLAHTFAQTGPFRPRNLVKGTRNGVLAGAGTTPGVGIPPVMISGRLAAERVIAAATRRDR